MKKVLCFLITSALVFAVIVLPAQSDQIIITPDSVITGTDVKDFLNQDTVTDTQVNILPESPFDPLLPTIRIVDDHFLAYYNAGITEQKPEWILGDSNIDGKVDAQDALFALIYGLNTSGYMNLAGALYFRDCPNNLYERAFVRVAPIMLQRYFENWYVNYYKKEPAQRDAAKLHLQTYRFNSILMADVSNDGTCDAVDALYILKYAVGAIDRFPRTDFSSQQDMFYIPWTDEWEPKMIHAFHDGYYDGILWPPENE